MATKGLLFIPDISGFTKFVSETEIDHSRLIIQELLEILLDANETGLEVSEIEGDAILFYKFGEPPSLETLYKQVEHMFCAFHQSLAAYDLRKYCQCKACTSAIDLSLKIITHYGEFTGYTVKHFSKLIGKDVIVAHQLLKNDIENHEYWLITEELLRDSKPGDLAEQLSWLNGGKQTETGTITFHYTWLTGLKNNLEPQSLPSPELSDKSRVLSLAREYETDIITLFHASGDFNYRARWLEDVQRVEEVNHFLPRIGMRCRYILADGTESSYVSNYYRYGEDRIEFSETDKSNQRITFFRLEKTGAQRTRLRIELYLAQNLLSRLSFRLWGRGKAQRSLQRSMDRLAELAKEIKLPG